MAKTLWFFADGAWQKVATSDEIPVIPVIPDVSEAIFFNADNEGGWLYTNTNNIKPSGPGSGRGVFLEDSSGGGIELNVQQSGGIGIQTFGTGTGTININSSSEGTGQIRITNNSGGGGIFIEDSGSGGDITIQMDGDNKLILKNTGNGVTHIQATGGHDADGSNGGIFLESDGGSLTRPGTEPVGASSTIYGIVLDDRSDYGIFIGTFGGNLILRADGDIFQVQSGGQKLIEALWDATDAVYEWTIGDGNGNNLLRIEHSSGAWHYHIKTGASWVADL